MKHAVLTEPDKTICMLYAEGYKISELASVFKMDDQNILLILENSSLPLKTPIKFIFTDEYLLNRLKELAKQLGRTPLCKDFAKQKPNINIYRMRFGSWRNALKLAGLESSTNGRRIYTDEYLLNLLKEREKQLGRIPTTRDYLTKQKEPVAISHYYKHFGTWNNALKLAGFEQSVIGIRNRRMYTDAYLLNYLKELAKQLGRTPNAKNFSKQKPSITIYQVRFGSWLNALKLAGLKPNPRGTKNVKRTYTDEFLLNHLRELAKQLDRTPYSKDFLWKKPSMTIYHVRFGSWRNALKLVGLEPNTMGASNGQLTYTDEYLLNRLKERAKQLGRTLDLKDFSGQKPNFTIYPRRFGSWLNALKLAGLEPSPKDTSIMHTCFN